MDQSRYEKYHGLYIVGTIGLILGIICLGFSLYMLPMILFNINVNLPLHFFKFFNWLSEEFRMSDMDAIKMTWELMTGFGIMCLVIANVTSNYIDNHLLKYKRIENPDLVREKEKDLIEVKHVVLILATAILFVLAGLKLFERGITS
jgi:hypothetical protein